MERKTGNTTLFASQVDQRFSFCLYVPTCVETNKNISFPLLVVIHGDARAAQSLRDAFADFAEINRCVVLAPLFPAGIIDPHDQHNYKRIKYKDIRYDHILLAIVEEISKRLPIKKDRFFMFGFSGGGQFVHRFFYLHPQRLQAISIGAPGTVTILDPTKKYWVGTKGFPQEFGQEIDLSALCQVKTQLIVGSEDTDTLSITIPQNHPDWIEGANSTGSTRIDLLLSLKQTWEAAGITVQFDIVPGVGHQWQPVLGPVLTFFQKHIHHTDC
jgi:hypothetical protein